MSEAVNIHDQIAFPGLEAERQLFGEASAGLSGFLRYATTVTAQLISRNRHLVTSLRDALLEPHTLMGRELTHALVAESTYGVQEELDLRIPVDA